MSKVIIVSNRLPEMLVVKDKVRTVRSTGGLVTALDAIVEQSGSIWVGWSGTTEAEYHDYESELDTWRAKKHFPVVLPDDIADKFYNGFVNGLLWPLFHSLPHKANFSHDNWEAFKQANELFRDEVVKHYELGDVIWVNDFQTFLLPRLIKEKLPDAKIGFFLHIPFPPADIFDILPHSKELLESVLEADFLGFHTEKFVDNFCTALERNNINTRTRIKALPVGTDFDMFNSPVPFLPYFVGSKVILAAERMDYMKGIVERLRSYEHLLHKYPEWHGRVILVQIAVASRGDVREVDELVGRINGGFGSLSWVPVVYVNEGMNHRQLARLYKRADIMWVNSLIDGMNLVCKEYIAARSKNDGELILSKFAGAAEKLREAIIVNPYDIEGCTEVLHNVLKGKLHCNMQALRERVKNNDIYSWATEFLKELNYENINLRR